jgi:O-methyltransferase involved in polyketide biosynthesis
MPEKIKLDLGSVQKTLLLPLWGRAIETRKTHPLLKDMAAVQIIDSIDYDFSTIALNINPITQHAWIARSIHIDRTVRRFVQDYPKATVVNNRMRARYDI